MTICDYHNIPLIVWIWRKLGGQVLVCAACAQDLINKYNQSDEGSVLIKKAR